MAALQRAKRLSCGAMQLFSRSPRGGVALAFTEEDLRAFHRERRELDIEPLAVHCPYIVNLASPDRAVWGRSLALYRQEYARCQMLSADYLVTHVGSHKGEGEKTAIKRVAEALNRTLDGCACEVAILLENTAGAGHGLGLRFEQLEAIRQRVMRKERVGICMDTAHLFAAGYPIHTREGLEAALDQFDRVIGLEHLRLIHLNDSKAIFNSHIDRHWHIGQGEIGLHAMRRIINHPRLSHLPFILETPKKTEEDDYRNLATVRKLLQSQQDANLSALRS